MTTTHRILLPLVALAFAVPLTSCTTVVRPADEPTTNTSTTTTRKAVYGTPSSASTETRTTQTY
jgi:hypothetical protein